MSTTTGVTVAAVATDPALDENSRTLLVAVYLAASDRSPYPTDIDAIEVWARTTGYYGEALATLAAMSEADR